MYLVPASETFALPHASEDVQGTDVLAVGVVELMGMGRFLMMLDSILGISATCLDSHFRHDIRISYLTTTKWYLTKDVKWKRGRGKKSHDCSKSFAESTDDEG